jgi:hypothetical protein
MMWNSEAEIGRRGAFWQAVSSCLIQFHRFDEKQANEAVDTYQRSVVSKMTSPRLIFHEEPFYLACDISEEELPLAKFREAYDHLLQEIA